MYGHRPRRLLRYNPNSPLPGGKVEIAVVPSGGERVVAGAVWAAWAGKPVEDVGRWRGGEKGRPANGPHCRAITIASTNRRGSRRLLPRAGAVVPSG